ncbi:MAG TPA: DNA translocase FtsK [Candidatus Limnocylindrales bacterium]|nr:DNA translocase FtsK [Candidatus Limnocylindrales bacterium]
MPRISLGLSPAVVRSLVGILLLGLGAVTLIALLLPGKGSLTDWWSSLSGPFFGTGRWLLPFVLLISGWYVEWGPGKEPGAPWGRTLLGIAMAYAGFLGLLQLTAVANPFGGEEIFTGGRIGRFLVSILQPLLTAPGAFVILLVLFVAGLLIAFDKPLRSILAPATGLAKAAGSTLSDRTARRAEADAMAAGRAVAGSTGVSTATAAGTGAGGRGRGARVPAGAGTVPGQTGAFGQDPDPDAGVPVPVASGSIGPMSATFAPARTPGSAGGNGAGRPADASATASPADAAAAGAAPGTPADAAEPVPPEAMGHPADAPVDASRAAITVGDAEFTLPPRELLDPGDPPAQPADSTLVHERNEAIIKKKLASFGIEADIIGKNAGPVVTQYVVQPAAHIKLSRIEALADDLAMALAARSIRIEAPIPGKAAVGIEIPNQEFNVVALRRILDEVDLGAAHISRLTFALGRDVAGRAQAVDLAKMPHLLIAGATGSGKSVMVNALITSLLCNAKPTEVRMVLIDLKRVELASYSEGEKLPHLLVPVITEPEKAKAALNWAVEEMERRYKKFAAVAARNIKAYNESPKVPERRRLPYIVIVIDELADLMMREGKNVEDPIVRLAQKARATGIHMVLATQRPSVNVVTGLIKANFPSRIAFAMASQIDSRTILDSPGAEDLIGRGDMLYQPSDLPRPIRHQGVFVSDREIAAVVQHWCDQVEDPRYDNAITSPIGVSVGNVDELADDEADRLLMDAVGVIREYDRASASLLQRRLKVGYARAARMIDQLEARGYIGAFDGSNARVVLTRDGDGGYDEVDDE